MRIEIAKDFFVEVSEETVEKDINIKVYLYLAEVRKAIEVMRKFPYDAEEYKTAYHVGDLFHRGWDGKEGVCTGLLDFCAYNENYQHLWDTAYNVYAERNAVADEKYREYAEGDFLKEFLNGVPSDEYCNNACLSDWHKDIYGYRPRGQRWEELVDLAKAYFSRV